MAGLQHVLLECPTPLGRNLLALCGDGFIGICRHSQSGDLSLLFAWNHGSGRGRWESNISFPFMWGRCLSQLLFPLPLACVSAVVPPAVSCKLHDSGVLSFLSVGLTGFLLSFCITVPQLPEHEVHVGVACRCQAKGKGDDKFTYFYQLCICSRK